MPSIGKNPLPTVVQSRIDKIAANAIKRNAQSSGMSELDSIFKGNTFMSRSAAISSDTLHLNYSGGKVGRA